MFLYISESVYSYSKEYFFFTYRVIRLQRAILHPCAQRIGGFPLFFIDFFSIIGNNGDIRMRGQCESVSETTFSSIDY